MIAELDTVAEPESDSIVIAAGKAQAEIERLKMALLQIKHRMITQAALRRAMGQQPEPLSESALLVIKEAGL